MDQRSFCFAGDARFAVQLFQYALKLPEGTATVAHDRIRTRKIGKWDHNLNVGFAFQNYFNGEEEFPGLAWAIRRESIDQFKFYDSAPSMDLIMARAFLGKPQAFKHDKKLEAWAAKVFDKVKASVYFNSGHVFCRELFREDRKQSFDFKKDLFKKFSRIKERLKVLLFEPHLTRASTRSALRNFFGRHKKGSYRRRARLKVEEKQGDFGVVYIAVGQVTAELCIWSIISLRNAGYSGPITMVTDRVDFLSRQGFDNIFLIDVDRSFPKLALKSYSENFLWKEGVVTSHLIKTPESFIMCPIKLFYSWMPTLFFANGISPI